MKFDCVEPFLPGCVFEKARREVVWVDIGSERFEKRVVVGGCQVLGVCEVYQVFSQLGSSVQLFVQRSSEHVNHVPLKSPKRRALRNTAQSEE